MMAGLMMVFLFVAVLFMSEVQKEQKAIKEIAEGYQNIQQQLYNYLNRKNTLDISICNTVFSLLKDLTNCRHNYLEWLSYLTY
jgi:glycerol-3-phosphate dehydrogenase